MFLKCLFGTTVAVDKIVAYINIFEAIGNLPFSGDEIEAFDIKTILNTGSGSLFSSSTVDQIIGAIIDARRSGFQGVLV